MKAWTYEKAGVPHLKGDAVFNRKIAKWIRATRVPGVMGGALGFAALFDPAKTRIKDPLLVSSTDGVGTKLEVAALQRKHDTVGIDLVAMSVNDIITSGARPVLFLDYYAAGKFHAGLTEQILKGVVDGCRQAGCALVGGETAIMPGFYSADYIHGMPQYDLSGFAVGVVDRRKVIDGSAVRAGDVLLGLASTGVHSNGFSLLRKIFSVKQLKGKIGRQLLTPTRIYVKPVLRVLERVPVAAIANITGGGFVDNLPRIIPQGLAPRIDSKSWPRPKLFEFIRDSGNISSFNMMRTFNLGIGMVLVLNKRDVRAAREILKRMDVPSWVIGEIIQGRSLEVV